MTFDCDVIIIGAGPGGYVAAIRASRLGLKPILIERDEVGGVCLNIGCIPSKSLIHHAEIFRSRKTLAEMGVRIDSSGFDYSKVQKRSRLAAKKLSKGVEYLLKKNNVELIKAEVLIESQNKVVLSNGKEITGENILIATGSRPRELPGFPFDEDKVISSTGALMLEKLPKRMLILGSGAVGIEFAHIFASFDVEIHIVEMLSRILPLEDEEISSILHKSLSHRGIMIHTSTRAESFKSAANGLTVSLQSSTGNSTEIETDQILVAVGRATNTENLGIENVNITPEKGFIRVNDYYRTEVSGIYAIGDIVNTPQLAHVASREGEIAVEHMAGLQDIEGINLDLIPSVVYCEPQVASFGLSEDRAKEIGIEYKKACFPYRGSGKSAAIEQPDGMIKILYEPVKKEILGAHIIGAESTELIHEILLAKKAELLPEDIGSMMHAHPTLSEIVMEVMRSIDGKAIHA
ncbi:MAG: dihydrolipoyl dehydrogenase [Candidatus Anammoxibacter sp.]